MRRALLSVFILLLSVRLSPGYPSTQPLIIKAIVIEGNHKTKEAVIRRDISLKPGDILNKRELIKSRRRLREGGYFSSVSLKPRSLYLPFEVLLEVKVVEGRSWDIFPGITYSSDNPNLGGVGIALFALERNLFGSGKRGTLKGLYAEDRYIDLSVEDPHFLDSAMALDLNFSYQQGEWGLFARDQRVDEFDRKERKIKVDWGVPVGDRIQLKGRFITHRVDDTNSNLLAEWGGKTISLGAGVCYDVRKNKLSPTTGFYGEMIADFSSEALGADDSFIKVSLDLRRFFNPFRGQVLALRLLTENATSAAPFYEQPQLGGASSMRGYERGRFVGHHSLLLNAEYRMELFKFGGGRSSAKTRNPWATALGPLKIDGVIFFDLGRTWTHQEKKKLSDLKNDQGIGLRFTPFPDLILRFDYGLSKEDRRFYFTYGHLF
ncbi:MAG: BamA/TamA family outer membrane protein [bacterium]